MYFCLKGCIYILVSFLHIHVYAWWIYSILGMHCLPRMVAQRFKFLAIVVLQSCDIFLIIVCAGFIYWLFCMTQTKYNVQELIETIKRTWKYKCRIYVKLGVWTMTAACVYTCLFCELSFSLFIHTCISCKFIPSWTLTIIYLYTADATFVSNS